MGWRTQFRTNGGGNEGSWAGLRRSREQKQQQKLRSCAEATRQPNFPCGTPDGTPNGTPCGTPDGTPDGTPRGISNGRHRPRGLRGDAGVDVDSMVLIISFKNERGSNGELKE